MHFTVLESYAILTKFIKVHLECLSYIICKSFSKFEVSIAYLMTITNSDFFFSTRASEH